MKFLFSMIASLFLIVGCASTGVTHLNDETYAEGVQGMTGITLFSADWCPACKLFKPVWEKVTKEYAGKLDFKYVNTDEAKQASQKIKYIPTMIVYLNGVPVGGGGALDIDSLRKLCDDIIKKKQDLDANGF